MKDQTSRILSTVLLLAVGYFIGMTRWPEPTYAQQTEAAEPVNAQAASGDAFVVVAGHASTSANAKHYYYVVGADGKATKVTIDGSPIYAPRGNEFPTKLQLKHDLPTSRIRLDHSGRVQQ